MNLTKKMTLPRLPSLLAKLHHSNEFLKVFSIGALLTSITAWVVVMMVSTKAPVVLTFDQSAKPMNQTTLPAIDQEVSTAIKAYVSKRYNWEPKTVNQRLVEANAFILPQSRKVFEQALLETVQFATAREVTQRAYTHDVQVSLTEKTALILGDRISAIQGLKAAGDLKVLLSFDYGPRTPENPWGIYITKEKEEQ